MGKCAQVITQAGNPICYFIPKQRLVKSLEWLWVSEIRSGVFTANAVKNPSGLWGGRKEFRNPPSCNAPVWFSCRHRQGQCYHHGMPVTSVWSVFSQKISDSGAVPKGSWGHPTPSMEERQENRFYSFGVTYFYCFFYFHWKEGFFFLSFQILLGKDFPSISFYSPVSEEQDKYFQQENPDVFNNGHNILFIFLWCRVTCEHALTFDNWWWNQQCYLFVRRTAFFILRFFNELLVFNLNN